MPDQIRVLIVDDIPETRDHLTKLLGFESDMTVVGAASSGNEAIELAHSLMPDVVLMDINMPDMDGIAATELLSAQVPTAAVVMMSVQGEADYLRRSMLAGAREFLVKPFSSDELTASIRQVYARERDKVTRVVPAPAAATAVPRAGAGRGQVIAFFSPKGGVGRTTMAVNMAVMAANELGRRVVIVDASFQFGDVGVLLNLNPKNKSIADLVPELANGGAEENVDTFVINHSSGVRVLLAPPSPEMAELITPGRRQGDPGGAPASERPRDRGLRRGHQRQHPGRARRGRRDPDDAHPRDHEHQEHAPLPRDRRPPGLRGRQDPASS